MKKCHLKENAMNEQKPLPPGWVNSNEFNQNSTKFPLEELRKYFGKEVAWSRDGTRIVASADELGELFRELDRLGIPSADVVVSYVPKEDEDTCP
jgi:hypothetical protein